MIRKGDVIENPVTGERLLFLETSSETGGGTWLALAPHDALSRARKPTRKGPRPSEGVVPSGHLSPTEDERGEGPGRAVTQVLEVMMHTIVLVMGLALGAPADAPECRNPPGRTSESYWAFVEALASRCPIVRQGVFGAPMRVGLVSDGPVTLLIERS